MFAFALPASLGPIGERRFGMFAVGEATRFGNAFPVLANAADVAPLMLQVAPFLVRPLFADVIALQLSYI